MKIINIEIRDIINFLENDLIRCEGSISGVCIDNLADVDHVSKTTLDWVIPSKLNKELIVENSKARVLIVDDSVKYTEIMKKQNKVLLVVDNPKRSLAEIGNHFFVTRPKSEIHLTAVIDKEAIIGKNVYIGPYCNIGKAIIGDNCIVDSNVRICDDVQIGNNSKIKHGAVLGSEGFGFERDSAGNKFRFPQIGGLLLGDDVEVGANTCIDRGALSDTIIGDHTKINNLCHIAHNNKIGKNVTIAGCVNISGSNVIEDDVWIAPNASIRGYIHLGKGCVIGMGAVVTKNVPDGETWIGNPAHQMNNK